MSEYYFLPTQILILELIYRAKLPLSSVQIADFMAEHHLAHFFTVQATLAGLAKADLLSVDEQPHRTEYSISDKGKASLFPYRDTLSKENICRIEAYLGEIRPEIKAQRDVRANYDRFISGGYVCHLKTIEDNEPLLDISIRVPTEELADELCRNFKTKNEDVYAHILDDLES